MNEIEFDCGPGVLPDFPEHRRWFVVRPDEGLVEYIEALAMLGKTVHNVRPV